jgi:uncharacterized membrane protein/ketosteroid isomerase-like protein
MIDIIPNWHPIWVHFAIALLVTSAALFLLFGWRSTHSSGRSNALIVARWTLRLGVIAAVGALLTGYLASGSVAHDDVSHANMMVHRNWALASTVIFAIIAIVEYMKRNETRFSILSALLLVAGSITLAVTGLEGAENVYEYGLGVQKLPNLSAHEHSGNENTSVQEHATHESEEGTHDNTQQFANEPQIVAKDDGHAHAHSDASSTPAYDNSNDKLNHPASLIAAQLADAIATGDINSLRSVVAPDVLIFESGGVESSLDEYEGHHMPADMAFMKAMQREVISRQVLDSGESATVVTRSRIHGMYKDQNVDRKSTETLVMRNEGGLWKVIHIHWSSS